MTQLAAMYERLERLKRIERRMRGRAGVNVVLGQLRDLRNAILREELHGETRGES